MKKYYSQSSHKIVAILATTAILGFGQAEAVQADENTGVNPTGSITEAPLNDLSQASDSVEIATVNSAESTRTEALVADVQAVEVTTSEAPITDQEALDEDPRPTATQAELVAEPLVEATATIDTRVTIAHTNDMHGRMEEQEGSVIGMANAAEFFSQIDADIIVDNGDAYQGLPLSNHDDGLSMAKAMSQAGYDAQVVGNHEFDFGQDVALNYSNEANFPLLSANIFYENDPSTTADDTHVFQPSTLVTTDNGYNIAIIGVTTPETATKTHPKNIENIKFIDPIPAVMAEMDRLLADQAVAEDAFIILAHLGLEEVTPEAWQGDTLVTNLDQATDYDAYQIVVLDGHSHSVVPAYNEGNVIYQQTGTELNNIGVIHFDPTSPGSAIGQLYSYDDVMALNNGATDEAVQAIVDEAVRVYGDETSAVVVDNNPVWLNGVREYVRTQQTNMGTLIGDLMVDYGQEGFANPTDFAMINGGGVREQIVQGQPITQGDVIAVLPFGNIIAQIEVSGEQLYDMFEFSYNSPVLSEEAVSSTIDPNGHPFVIPLINEESGLPNLGTAGKFLQVSSDIKVYFDPTAPSGNRILGVYMLNDVTGQYDLVANDDSQTYFMATNDFLAQGGDGFTMLAGLPREEGPSLDQVVMTYLQTGGQEFLRQYEEATPLTNIIPIRAADYAALLAEDQVTVEDLGEGLGEDKDEKDLLANDKATPQAKGQPSGQVISALEEGLGELEGLVEAYQSAQAKEEANGSDVKDDAKSEDVEKATLLPQTGSASGPIGLAVTFILSGLGLIKRKED